MSRPPTPLSWAIVAFLALTGTTLWGQRPNPRTPPQTSLVPAEPVWSIALEGDPIASGAIDAAHVYISLRIERVVAISREDGRTVWSRDIESTTTPVVADGTVYVMASDEVHALDAQTGSERWRAPFDHHLNIGLALVGDRLIGVIEPATIVAMSVADGSILWQRPVTAAPLRPLVGNGPLLFAALADGTVTALAALDGTIGWSRRLEGTLAQPLLVGDRLIVGTAANEVFALDAKRGSIDWRWRVGGDVIGAGSSQELVFVASMDNMLRAVSRSSGNQRWKRPIPSRPAHPPQFFGDQVVISTASPTISVYSALTGVPVGTYVAPGEVEGPALVAPLAGASTALMVVITRDGRVVGLRPKPPAPPTAPAASPVAPTTGPREGGSAPQVETPEVFPKPTSPPPP